MSLFNKYFSNVQPLEYPSGIAHYLDFAYSEEEKKKSNRNRNDFKQSKETNN